MSYTYVSREGLKNLLSEGLEVICEQRVSLPFNFVESNMDYKVENNGDTYYRRLEVTGNAMASEEAERLIEQFARMGGWLKKAPEFPGICRLFAASPKWLGATIDLWAFVRKYPSPGNAERRLWAVRERAAQILSGTGIMPSWVAIGNALLCHASTGKAAVIAAAMTLSADRPKSGRIAHFGYREARAFLMEYFSSIEKYSQGGVRHAPEPFKVLDGVEFYAALFPSKKGVGFNTGFILRRLEDGRTYHKEYDCMYDHQMEMELQWDLECEFEHEIAHTGVTYEEWQESQLLSHHKYLVEQAEKSWEDSSAA